MNAIKTNDDDKMEWQDNYYACPLCKQPLTPTTNGLCCKRDEIEYPVKNGIVDFVTEDLTKSTSPVLKTVHKLDDLAKVYEGPSWYGALNIIFAELGLPSIEEGAKMMTKMVDAESGVGLDVACGTGFFARFIAQKMRLVYGIDISMGMLEKAVEYEGVGRIRNICFARSKAEQLPFPDGVFDWVTCSAALHMFQDTTEALREMARVMKTGARLAVMTVVKQDLPTLKLILERASNLFDAGALEAMHIFDVEELESYLSRTGFKGFEYDTYGPYILFDAEKA